MYHTIFKCVTSKKGLNRFLSVVVFFVSAVVRQNSCTFGNEYNCKVYKSL